MEWEAADIVVFAIAETKAEAASLREQVMSSVLNALIASNPSPPLQICSA